VETSPPPTPSYAVVLAGGDPVDPSIAARLPTDARVIAADSGLAQAKLLGLIPDLVIGDLDSVDPTDLAEAQAADVPVERHPEDKDATDLELALDRAVAMGHSNVILIGGHGGRLDHLLGNALVLASDRYGAVHIEWWVRDTRVVVARARECTELAGTMGDVVSLIAVGGPATDIVTAGLRWPLENETLAPGSTRGISNELTASAASVTIGSGVLLLIHEGSPT